MTGETCGQPKPDAPTIWAVGMVRDEEDVIDHVIRHLLAERVDHILVADNLSTDRTRRLLDDLALSLPVTVVDDPDPAYRQSEKMTALARRAGLEGATWVIPFDADELWTVNGRPLGDYLRSLSDADVDVVAGDWYHHYAPLLRRSRPPFKAMSWRDAQPDTWPKVAFRYRPDIVIEMGNHRVVAPSPLRERHDPALQIHHYRYRGFSQMARKCRQGAQAVDLAGYPEWVQGGWRYRAGLGKPRLAVMWARMALTRSGRVRDQRLPTTLRSS